MNRRALPTLCMLGLIALSSASTDTLLLDFNRDNNLDSVIIEKSVGSGFSSKDVTIINGKTGQRDTLRYGSAYCQFRTEVLIPQHLQKEENRALLDTIVTEVLPPKREEADPSLAWIQSGLKQKRELTETSFFKTIIHPSLAWVREWQPPSAYCIKQASRYLVYFGHNHFRNPTGDSLSEVYSKRRQKLYRTSHGLLLHNTRMGYAWIFVSDVELTGAPGKLRWESIKDTEVIADRYVILLQGIRLGSDALFIIDSKTGTIAQIRLPYDDYLKLSLKEDSVQLVSNEISLNSIPFTEIIKEFKKIE